MENSQHVQQRLIPTPEIARRLGLSVRTIQNLRWKRETPDGWVALSTNLMGLPEEIVDSWVAARLLAAAGNVVASRDRMSLARAARHMKPAQQTANTTEEEK